jgi:hypothetical protein
VSRDDEIQAILEVGRRTRKPTPRWMWIAAMAVGVICAAGFAVAMLGHPSRPGQAGDPSRPGSRAPGDARDADRSASRPGLGLGLGLLLGAGAGVAIGVAIARQRRHSSRNIP